MDFIFGEIGTFEYFDFEIVSNCEDNVIFASITGVESVEVDPLTSIFGIIVSGLSDIEVSTDFGFKKWQTRWIVGVKVGVSVV